MLQPIRDYIDRKPNRLSAEQTRMVLTEVAQVMSLLMSVQGNRSIVLEYISAGGDDMESTFTEMLDYADKLQVEVRSTFNGIVVWVQPGDELTKIIAEYKEAVRRRNLQHGRL